jgi:hypothetical protein
VFTEDAVSVSGDVIALAGLALNQVTGSSIPQGVAAVVIGLMLIRFGLRLVRRSHDFLVGAWLLTLATPQKRDADGFTQLLQPSDEEGLRTFLLAYPGVTAIREVLVKFVGPGQVWVVARLDIADDLRGDQVKSLVRGIESGLKHASETSTESTSCPLAERRPHRSRQPAGVWLDHCRELRQPGQSLARNSITRWQPAQAPRRRRPRYAAHQLNFRQLPPPLQRTAVSGCGTGRD